MKWSEVLLGVRSRQVIRGLTSNWFDTEGKRWEEGQCRGTGFERGFGLNGGTVTVFKMRRKDPGACLVERWALLQRSSGGQGGQHMPAPPHPRTIYGSPLPRKWIPNVLARH